MMNACLINFYHYPHPMMNHPLFPLIFFFLIKFIIITIIINFKIIKLPYITIIIIIIIITIIINVFTFAIIINNTFNIMNYFSILMDHTISKNNLLWNKYPRK